VERRGYTAWTKTPTGGTYYIAVILLDIIFFIPLMSPSGLSSITLNRATVVIGSGVVLLALTYWGTKLEERKYLKMHGSLEKDGDEASSTKKIIEDFIFPPTGVLIISAVMWWAANGGADKILGVRIIALTCILSLLTFLYPLTQRLRLFWK
jgi:hypothetical protein